jgi:hypothetical protein
VLTWGILRGEKHWESHNSWVLDYEGIEVVLAELGLVLMRIINMSISLNSVYLVFH